MFVQVREPRDLDMRSEITGSILQEDRNRKSLHHLRRGMRVVCDHSVNRILFKFKASGVSST